MKLITLNTWGGIAGKDILLDFFKAHKDVDIFCLQEIWSASYDHLEGQLIGGVQIDSEKIMDNGMQHIAATLPEHASYFHPHHLEHYGLQMLVKKDLKIIKNGDVFVYKQRGYIPEGDYGNHARNIQHTTIEVNSEPITIINFHGLWNGQGKTDTEDRINQSKNIVEFIQTLTNDFILCGDFNLLPDSKSIAVFEDAGLRNLIREYKITSTRTSFYKKEVKYADYMFVSKGVDVKDFKVLPDEVSDHNPLLLEFDIK